MYCHKCGKEGKEGSRYCDSCGSLLGDLTQTNKKFCHNCGTKLHNVSEEKVEKNNRFDALLGFQVIGVMGVILIVIGILPGFLHNSPISFSPASTSITTATTSSVSTSVPTTSTIPQISNPVSGTQYANGIEYSANTKLSGDIATKGSITIDHGVTVVTNGYSMIAGETFKNQGIIDAGMTGDKALAGVAGQSYINSFGGAGGAGGGGGGKGLNGTGGWSYPITNTLIAKWYDIGMSYYLTGAGGGGGCQHGHYAASGGSTLMQGGIYSNRTVACGGNGGLGGSGSYGVFIQADRIIAGTIKANGQAGGTGQPDGGGGGGGGAIMLAYGNGGYIAGTYSFSGGANQSNSGWGGKGQVLTYSFGSTPPITQP